MGLLIEIEFGEIGRLVLEGSVDSTTAPQLKEAISRVSEEAKIIIFDFKKVKYISSAGLRVLLSLKKQYPNKDIEIHGASSDVMEVFDITGFASLFIFK